MENQGGARGKMATRCFYVLNKHTQNWHMLLSRICLKRKTLCLLLKSGGFAALTTSPKAYGVQQHEKLETENVLTDKQSENVIETQEAPSRQKMAE